MCSLRDPLETCPSLGSMVQTNYSYELSSHSISNTRPGFFPGPGIRRWGPRCTTNVQRGLSELLCHTSFWVLGNQSTCNLKRSVLFLQQEESRCKAVTKEICLSRVSGISDYVNGVIPTVSDFIQEPSFGYIHISQCARSGHISKRQDFKVLEGRGRKTSGQWLTYAAKSEL